MGIGIKPELVLCMSCALKLVSLEETLTLTSSHTSLHSFSHVCFWSLGFSAKSLFLDPSNKGTVLKITMD